MIRRAIGLLSILNYSVCKRSMERYTSLGFCLGFLVSSVLCNDMDPYPDRALDALLNKAGVVMTEFGLDVVPVLDLRQQTLYNVLGLEFTSELHAQVGTCYNLTKLRRVGNLKLEKGSNSSESVQKHFMFSLKIDGLQCSYQKFQPKFLGIGPTFRLEALPNDNEILIKFATFLYGRKCILQIQGYTYYKLSNIRACAQGYWLLHKFYDGKANDLATVHLAASTKMRILRFLTIAIERASLSDELCNRIHTSV